MIAQDAVFMSLHLNLYKFIYLKNLAEDKTSEPTHVLKL